MLSVHSIVSFDFAVSLLPGWHTTIFPPYFVAGAVFGGFAMVLTLIIPARKAFRFENVITNRHLENMAKVMLVTSMIVGYGYLMENFIAWYCGNPYEAFLFFKTRPFGHYAAIFWIMLACNVLVPQTFWWKKARTNVAWLWVASILVGLGMWAERFVIIVISLQPRLPALVLGQLRAHLGRLVHLPRDHLLLLAALPALPPLRARRWPSPR